MNWPVFFAVQAARMSAMWAWANATELRRSIRRVGFTLFIAGLAWLWPFAVLIVIAVQITQAFTRANNETKPV
jgi:hypothetical protein